MYNRKKYRLPKEVYMQTLWAIRDYPRLKEEYGELILKAPVMDGQPKGSSPGDPTGMAAVKCAEISVRIKCIDDALQLIPPEYRQGVFSNIVDRVPYPDYAYPDTWRIYRQRFIFYTAVNMGLR